MTIMSGKLTGLFVRAAVGAGVVGIILDLAGVTSLIRVVLVLVFIAVAPTAAIAGLLRRFDRFARLVIACVTATAVVALIAMAMLTAGLWSPTGGLIAVAAFSAGCWLAQRRPVLRTAVVAPAESLRRALIRCCTDGGREFQADGAQLTVAKLGQGSGDPVSASASRRGDAVADAVMAPAEGGSRLGIRDGAVNGAAVLPSNYRWSAAAADEDTIELHGARYPDAVADAVMAPAEGGSRLGIRDGAVNGAAVLPSNYRWSAAAADEDTIELHGVRYPDAMATDLPGLPDPARTALRTGSGPE